MHGEQSRMVKVGKSTLNLRATQRANKTPQSTKKKFEGALETLGCCCVLHEFPCVKHGASPAV